MSDPSPRNDRAVALDLGSLALPLDGSLRRASAHAISLSRFFPAPLPSWSDAMVMRTRRQAGGCVAAVDAALRLAMIRRLPQIEIVLENLPAGHVWTVIAEHPELLSPALFAQFRLRAAMGLLIGRDDGEAGRMMNALAADDPAIAQALAALTAAQLRWSDRGMEDAPVTADLPAVAMEELVSLCCAVLVQALMASDVVPVDQLLDCAQHSCDVILAHHDEEAGALGVAALIARALDGRPLDDALLCALAQERQLLLCALIAQRSAVPVDQVGLALIDGRDCARSRTCPTKPPSCCRCMSTRFVPRRRMGRSLG